MKVISRFALRGAISQLNVVVIKWFRTIQASRSFSHGPPPLQMDFSEKVNLNEIKLKDPKNLKKMNMCNSITDALDLALTSNSKYFSSVQLSIQCPGIW